MYDPETGVCVQGPCSGAALKRLPFSVADGKLLVAIEETDGNSE
jgi:nitrite reductase/ring-hydroxylating ferredoxin subunit